jgi:hypothetical protein
MTGKVLIIPVAKRVARNTLFAVLLSIASARGCCCKRIRKWPLDHFSVAMFLSALPSVVVSCRTSIKRGR